jgi:hypothetical protein
MVDSELKNEFDDVDIQSTDEMEELCLRIRMVADVIKNASSEAKQSVIQERLVQSGTNLTLPKIELPKFDGDAVQWCSFRDLFLSLVHNNQNISIIERFNFLRSCLTGPALAVIKTFPLTADNHSIAWNALQKSFENN